MLGHVRLLTSLRRVSCSTTPLKSRTLAKDTKTVPHKLLRPRELSQRLKVLSDQNKLTDAVALLKSSPKDAQNVPVWNTLIWQCLKAKQFQLAFRLYVDVSLSLHPIPQTHVLKMKRRGFVPNIRTYQTVLNGYAKIDNWASHSKQLKNMHAIFQSYMRYRESMNTETIADEDDYNAPLTAYFSILGATGLQQKMFDIYYELDKEGPFAPNHFLYSSMFRALSCKEGPSETEKAASAKLLWAQMLKAAKRNNFPVDSFLVSGAVTALAKGRPADQNFAFQLVRDYFGLVSPPADEGTSGLIPVERETFASVLILCNTSKRYQAAIDFFNQLLHRPGGSMIVDRAHIETVFQAYIALSSESTTAARESVHLLEWMLRQEITMKGGGSHLRPVKFTFDLVLRVCWQNADWPSAMRTFDLMSGYHAHDFMDGSVAAAPRLDERSNNRNIMPDSETLSTILSIALSTKSLAHMRQALRIVDYILSTEGGIFQLSRKRAKKQLFFARKLADAIVGTVQRVLVAPSSQQSSGEVNRWQYLADEARQTLALMPVKPNLKFADNSLIPTLTVDRP